MRIVSSGDQFWQCHRLAAGVLRRMATRYGLLVLRWGRRECWVSPAAICCIERGDPSSV